MIASLRRVGVTAFAAASLAGCGTQPSPPGADPGPAAPPREPARPSRPPPPALDSTDALLGLAFHGAVPAFPLLAGSGNEVAMGIASPVGGSTVATYRVVTFSNWTTVADAWGNSTVDYPLVDPTMATMLLDRAMGEPAPSPDPLVLAERARAITRHLDDGEFSPFDHAPAALGPDDLTLGSVKLRTTHGSDAELIVRLLDTADRELAATTIPTRATGLVADVACVSTPVARRAWLDTARKRVLVEVGWNAGGAGCPTLDLEYGMWPTP